MGAQTPSTIPAVCEKSALPNALFPATLSRLSIASKDPKNDNENVRLEFTAWSPSFSKIATGRLFPKDAIEVRRSRLQQKLSLIDGVVATFAKFSGRTYGGVNQNTDPYPKKLVRDKRHYLNLN